MPAAAVKNTPQRHLADADFHIREAEAALRRARDRVPGQALEGALDQLAKGQRSARTVIGRMHEHIRRGQAT